MNIGYFFGTLLLPLLMAPGNLVAGPQYASGSTGVDISYPNCRAPVPKSQFGIVGINGGRISTKNQCFLPQAMQFPSTASLYVNTGWNGKIKVEGPKKCTDSDLNCQAYNYGYAAGAATYTAATVQWIRSNTWWLDVETSNSWSDDVLQNRQSVQGEYDALKDQGVATVGVYSTSYQWQKITGGWRNGWPSWAATVVQTADEARYFCTAHEFTGGRTLMVQFLPKGSAVDHDIIC